MRLGDRRRPRVRRRSPSVALRGRSRAGPHARAAARPRALLASPRSATCTSASVGSGGGRASLPSGSWRGARAVPDVAAPAPPSTRRLAWGAQLIVVKGDLTDDDRDRGVRAAREPPRHRSPCPSWSLPGNHDGGDRSNGDGVAVLAGHGVELITTGEGARPPRAARRRRELTRAAPSPRQPHAAPAGDHRGAARRARRCAARDAPSAVPHGCHHDLAARHPRPRRLAPAPRRGGARTRPRS